MRIYRVEKRAAAPSAAQPQPRAEFIFQAERHTNLSNFRIETTIGCFIEP